MFCLKRLSEKIMIVFLNHMKSFNSFFFRAQRRLRKIGGKRDFDF